MTMDQGRHPGLHDPGRGANNEEDMYLSPRVFHNRPNSGGVNPSQRQRRRFACSSAGCDRGIPTKNRNSVPADLLDSFQSHYDTL